MKSAFRNWSDIRVFLAVVRDGSTLAASRKLGVAQPTVARRIEVLEHETGLTLFERDTRGFRPTEDARQLVPLAEAIEAAAGRFAEKARGLTGKRTIRITSPGPFSEESAAIFSEFAALNPGTAFEFFFGVQLLDLTNGEADIAIRVAAGGTDAELICRHIGTEHMALYGAPGYADKNGLPQSVDDLDGHRFVTFERDDIPAVLHDWLAQHVTPEQIVISFGDLDLMLAAIRTGHGLGLVVARWADTDDTLIRCFGNIEELSRPVTMLIAPEAYRRPEVRAFARFFAPRFAAAFRGRSEPPTAAPG